MYDDVYLSQFIRLQTLKTFLVLESSQSSPPIIFKSLLNTKTKGSGVPSGFREESSSCFDRRQAAPSLARASQSALRSDLLAPPFLQLREPELLVF